MKKERIVQNILDHKIVAIVRNVDQSDISATIKAIYDGGIRLIEIAFDSSQEDYQTKTSYLIKSALELNLPDLVIGAGTVVSLELLDVALQSGAQYILSPSYNSKIIQKANSNNLVVIPGCFSPTEIVDAYADGADFIKLFPAHRLGPDYIKDLRGPIGRIPILAVGGINEENCLDYLEAGAVGLGIGSNLVNPAHIQQGDYHKITDYAQNLVSLIHKP